MALVAIVLLPRKEESGVNSYYVILILAAVNVLLNVCISLIRPYFLLYSDAGEKLSFRYYPMSLLNRRRNIIEIYKSQFVKYELKDYLFGSQQEIVLYQVFRKKMTRYPPIPLSALNKKDRARLLASLDKYAKKP
ncbi:MAG: hypothetical protein CSA96_04870 [Bacteroidetes bacterium]|nr:MAG: hypothetical protein CSA96_04870 [Bacteroidota bacterium]